MKLVNLPETKPFNIVTRFYDPQIEGEGEVSTEMGEAAEERTILSHRERIKGHFRKPGKRLNSRTVAEVRSKSNMRLVYILIILIALIYFFMK